MIKILKGINPEYKVAAVFALTAMFVSLLTGAVCGIIFGTVLLRAFCSILIFAGLGFGVFFVMKKYVPELFELMGNTEDDFTKDDFSKAEDGEEDGFTEFTGSDFPNLDESLDDAKSASEMSDSAVRPDGSMGRHIVEENSDFPYEPEVMAKAVRTMMSKGDDE
ncbi:MAG: hypothetical protein FWG13_05000 [Leptospirales bacterium]|nr:hypothetical protein [Leptospirales bacterium]